MAYNRYNTDSERKQRLKQYPINKNGNTSFVLDQLLTLYMNARHGR